MRPKTPAQWLRRITVGYPCGQIVETAVVAVWAEARVGLATEFRDGNVPAGKDPLSCARTAFAQPPGSVQQRAFRGDSACDHGALPAWLDDERPEGGPEGRIDYAISVRMVDEIVRAADHRMASCASPPRAPGSP